jgi:putative transposase
MNVHSFANIFIARRLAEEWRADYNDVRPHSAFGYLTPREFADRHEFTQPAAPLQRQR